MEPFGLLNVLKPPGMSSHDVVGFCRRTLKTKRVGHGGTLDPAAAGVMAVAVGKATRLLGYIRHDKAYLAEVTFGFATDSADAEGAMLAEADASGLTQEALLAALPAFRGLIRQRPPMASAVHVGGKRLYELHRAGVTLETEQIPEREVTILRLELEDFVPGKRAVARLWVTCTAGTYIRSLAVDLGAALGLPACLTFLLRTQAGDCQLSASQTLEEVALEPHFLPIESWLGHLPAVTLDARGVEDIGFGRQVPSPEAFPADTTIRLNAPDGSLLALATPRGERLQPVLVL